MPRVSLVLAPNPGPFTLEGTNTWIVGQDPSLVIDPGPEDERHLEDVQRESGRIAAILLTHHHADHAAGAATLARAAGAPIMAFALREDEHGLSGGERIEAGDVSLRPLVTPRHSPDHVVYHDPISGWVFSGDAVLGRGMSVVDPPEGDMDRYVRSLDAMLALRPRALYPGHGPRVDDAVGKLREYIGHRRERERQILHALTEAGVARSPRDLVPDIYGDYPSELHEAAARSVLAHLLKLERDGRVGRVASRGEERFVAHRGPVPDRDVQLP